jgi:hypothetical protein
MLSEKVIDKLSDELGKKWDWAAEERDDVRKILRVAAGHLPAPADEVAIEIRAGDGSVVRRQREDGHAPSCVTGSNGACSCGLTQRLARQRLHGLTVTELGDMDAAEYANLRALAFSAFDGRVV